MTEMRPLYSRISPGAKHQSEPPIVVSSGETVISAAKKVTTSNNVIHLCLASPNQYHLLKPVPVTHQCSDLALPDVRVRFLPEPDVELDTELESNSSQKPKDR